MPELCIKSFFFAWESNILECTFYLVIPIVIWHYGIIPLWGRCWNKSWKSGTPILMGTSFAFMMMVGTFIIMTRGAEYFLDIAADDQLLEKYIDQHKNRLERIYEENIRKPLWEQENLPSEAILDSHRKGPDIFFLLTSNVSCGSIPLLRQDGKIIMGDKIYQKFINLLPEKLSTKMHHLNEQETTPGIAPHEEIQRKNDLKKLNAYRQLFSAGAKYSLKASEKDLRILSCGWCKKQSICVGIGSILIIMMWTARQAYQDIQARPSKKN